MTPVLDYMLRNAAGIEKAWDPKTSGIPSFRSFLDVIADAAIYHIPEAETDTTASVEAYPDHYATNANVRMPWPTVWIEHRSYRDGVDYMGDTALLLQLRPKDQIVVCYAVSLTKAPNPLFLKPIVVFALSMSELGNVNAGTGKEYQLRPSIFAKPDTAAKVCDFVRELLAYIHSPVGVVETMVEPSQADQRALRRVLGQAAFFPHYHVLRTSGDLVSRTSVLDRAAAAMGVMSEAVN